MATDDITLGEYIRRKRRALDLSLHGLAEKSGVAYTHLSRIEADSTTPNAETVAKLCTALDGDLKLMLEMADCLPRVILDRIEEHQRTPGSPALHRAFEAPADGLPAETRSLSDLARAANLTEDDAGEIMMAVNKLLQLSKGKRAAVASLIALLYAEGDESSA